MTQSSLGAFSISLAVKDIEASKTFYETLGFSKMGGDQSQGWLILKNGPTIVGLFQGMFDKTASPSIPAGTRTRRMWKSSRMSALCKRACQRPAWMSVS